MKRPPCLAATGGIVAMIILLLLSGAASGYDLTDKFSIGGIRLTAEF